MQDLRDVQDVEVSVDGTGKLWVNIEGRCVLRVGHARLVIFDDPVRGLDTVYEDSEKEADD